MRSRFAVSYDVTDDKRLRKLYKKMCGFGDPVQYSVFLCPLSPAEKAILIDAVKAIINQKEDRVMLIDMGPIDGRGSECIEFVGKRREIGDDRAVVV
jgi:CRISPR-associated protein Cas2